MESIYFYFYFAECLYQYLRQPPSEITDCNPYSSTSNLVLECQASVPTSEVDGAEIQWFNRNQRITLNDFIPLAGIEQVTESEGDTDRSIVTSTLTLDGERFITTDGDGSGSYHCQIVVGGSDAAAISDQLVINSQDTYSSITEDCSDTYSEETISCAYSPTTTTPTASAAPATPTTPSTEYSNTTDSAILPETTAPPTAPPTSPPTSPGGGTDTAEGSPLQVWVYVLVAIAAVFGMIIVVLAILCVGLCLKKNKTEDTNKRK